MLSCAQRHKKLGGQKEEGKEEEARVAPLFPFFHVLPSVSYGGIGKVLSGWDAFSVVKNQSCLARSLALMIERVVVRRCEVLDETD